jgi:hypothetical protein
VAENDERIYFFNILPVLAAFPAGDPRKQTEFIPAYNPHHTYICPTSHIDIKTHKVRQMAKRHSTKHPTNHSMTHSDGSLRRVGIVCSSTLQIKHRLEEPVSHHGVTLCMRNPRDIDMHVLDHHKNVLNLRNLYFTSVA